jgi:CHAD domain-containing protein
VINHLRKALLSQMERTAAAPTEDAVHDLRVAVRRLSEAISNRKSRKQLRQIRDRAAAVRDRDITIQLLRRPKNDPIVNYLQGQRDFAAAELTKSLTRKLRHPLELPPEQGTPPPLLTRVDAFLDADPAQLHALRIAAKRLRYAIEIRYPDGAEPWLKRLRLIQRHLGDWQDLQAAADLIAPHPRARAIVGELNTRAAVLAARFQHHWQRHFGPRVRQRLRAWAKEQT